MGYSTDLPRIIWISRFLISLGTDITEIISVVLSMGIDYK